MKKNNFNIFSIENHFWKTLYIALSNSCEHSSWFTIIILELSNKKKIRCGEQRTPWKKDERILKFLTYVIVDNI
jgi:hypothetical protein